MPPPFVVIHPAIPPIKAPITRTLRANPAVEISPLTTINGIGSARARQLNAVGITSLEHLAAASPETVAAGLGGPGMSLDTAEGYISQAKQLIGKP
jgi:predicted flap endonuclease-1-like 5' DNA nuclease